MACRLHVTWDERLADYHFGPGHPLAPVRVELTMRLAHEFGLWAQPGVTMTAPDPATGADLALVHDPRYIAAVRTVSGWADDLGARGLGETHLSYARTFGLGTGDNPVFPGMHHASALVAGATLAAARAVWSGSAQHGASIAGGMHHAMAAHASGFGVCNDVAVAIAWPLGQGAERVGYVASTRTTATGCRPRSGTIRGVLTISLHLNRGPARTVMRDAASPDQCSRAMTAWSLTAPWPGLKRRCGRSRSGGCRRWRGW
jgi:acetoin utilization protein AcuC